jgi:hypothetical protein
MVVGRAIVAIAVHVMIAMAVLARIMLMVAKMHEVMVMHSAHGIGRERAAEANEAGRDDGGRKCQCCVVHGEPPWLMIAFDGDRDL